MILNPWDRQGNQIADGRGVYPNLRGCGGAGYQQGYVLSFDGNKETYALDHVITTGGNCTAQGPCFYKEVCPTIKASGPHSVAIVDETASVMCLNDQGGGVMHITHDFTEPLRAQMKHHEPIVLCTSECRCYDAYQHHGWRESETIGTMTELQNVFVRGDTPLVVVFDARGNGGGETAPTITGDHQDRITDYTAIVVEGNAEDIHREEIL